MKVKEIYSAVALGASSGPSFNFEMPKSNRGIFMVKTSNYASISALTLKLQGRLSSDMDFVDVVNASITLNTAGCAAVEDIQLYPEMRLAITTFTGNLVGSVIAQVGC